MDVITVVRLVNHVVYMFLNEADGWTFDLLFPGIEKLPVYPVDKGFAEKGILGIPLEEKR